MFEYEVYKYWDNEEFEKACIYIEDNFSKEIQNKKRITEVDGTQWLVYYTVNGKIRVVNDELYDWVVVLSDFEIVNHKWKLHEGITYSFYR